MAKLIGDGRTDNTKVFSELLVEGASIVLEEGVYLTGSISIPSGVTLTINKGATLKFKDDFSLYPPVYSRWEGVKCWCMRACLFVENAHDVVIRGEGTIDGSGQAWWDYIDFEDRRHKQMTPIGEIEKNFAKLNPDYLSQPGGGGGRYSQFLRPPLFQALRSRNVTLEGVTIKDSPFWTIHPVFSSHLIFRGLTIKNPANMAPNTDGFDIDSCDHVTIEDCEVFVGDDGICLKSGSGKDGIADAYPCSDIHIENCTVYAAHGGVVLGSETASGIRNVVARNCRFIGTDRGIRIKSRRGRGGVLENLVFENLHSENTLCPLTCYLYYRGGAQDPSSPLYSLDPQPVTDETPVVRNMRIVNCTSTGSRAAAMLIAGLPESPIENVVIKDCNFDVDPNTTVDVNECDQYLGLPTPASRGVRLRNVRGLKLENISVTGVEKGLEMLIESGVELV